MRIRFTKMQGAGNDFVVLDETHTRLGLSAQQYRFLGDRHFGVGADQVLTVRAAPSADIDFEYVIHNADGLEVEHCGNGARCFLRFVRQRGLTQKNLVRVKTLNRLLELRYQPDGQVTVDMGVPVFDLPAVPFDPSAMLAQPCGDWQLWPLDLPDHGPGKTVRIAVLSMGNPHAVQLVDNIDVAPVAVLGPQMENHRAFPQRVNAGFMQVLDRTHIRLRVFERGAGETLSCGTGACAAVVAGRRLGLLDSEVDVSTHGGYLKVRWHGGASPVLLTGPATTVFEGEIDLPDVL